MTMSNVSPLGGTLMTFGQRVIVRARLMRERDEHGARWVRHELAAPQRGILIGRRNRHDGVYRSAVDDGYEGGGGSYYAAKRAFQTLLIAIDMNRVPLVAMPEDVGLSGEIIIKLQRSELENLLLESKVVRDASPPASQGRAFAFSMMDRIERWLAQERAR